MRRIMRWWRQPDHYAWLSGYLQARSLASPTQKLMAVISGSLALFPVNMGADCRNTFVSITRIFDENHTQDLKLVLRDVWVSVERLLHGIPHHLADIGGAWLLSAAWLRGGAGRTVNAGRAPGQKHESSD